MKLEYREEGQEGGVINAVRCISRGVEFVFLYLGFRIYFPSALLDME
jgi:hypothetical protein